MSKPLVSIAGDYAVLEVGDLYFYYGYEHLWCLDDNRFQAHGCEDTHDTEWAFCAKRGGKIIAEYRHSPEFDEFNVEQQLICGLGKYIAEGPTP